jgi:hypothetical protein
MSKGYSTGSRDPRPISEFSFEQYCREHNIEYRRIRESTVPGHQRPDYRIKVEQRWWVVEVKEAAPTPFDRALLQGVLSGEPRAHWLKPGHRLRQSIKDAAG